MIESEGLGCSCSLIRAAAHCSSLLATFLSRKCLQTKEEDQEKPSGVFGFVSPHNTKGSDCA